MTVQVRPQIAPTDEELSYLNVRYAPMRFERSLKGELVVSPPTGLATGMRNNELYRQLNAWNDRHGHGAVLESSTGVSIGLLGSPDAGWLSGERYRSIPLEQREKFLTIAPEVVFELRSPSDLAGATVKRAAEWVTAGVSIAIVLDPFERFAIRCDDRGASAPIYPTLTFASALLPGADADLVLDLPAIFDA
jgi:Uma2 family endonuclease